eukprot:comp10842_c0_seq1/m.13378 comp10842_c0_seq1/g.13378  ORF comp10842_c0_seq1/g.13378 comp10842_c0_seq1/m.13378 type:complete len:175 (+) comp10842_c0_seq1:957-1481(+)
MKFGKHLAAARVNGDFHSYVDYKTLKRAMKEIVTAASTDAKPDDKTQAVMRKDEAFLKLVISEIDKCNRVYLQRDAMLKSHVEAALKRTLTVLELTGLIVQITDLEQFAYLNCTAVQKIIKKHDKWTPGSSNCAAEITVKLLRSEIFHSGNPAALKLQVLERIKLTGVLDPSPL